MSTQHNSKLKTDHEKYISLLKQIPSSTVLDCEFCQCECLNNLPPKRPKSSCRDRNNNKPLLSSSSTNRKKKSKKSKRSKSASSSYFTRDCTILKDIYHELPRNPQPSKSPPPPSLPTFDPWPNDGGFTSSNEIQLCESMQNLLCLSPKLRRAYRKIPLHDQKILNRMAKNRSEKANLTENAWLAQKFWENEKYERELLKCEQEEEYKKAIREKQSFDYVTTRQRLEALSKRDLDEMKRLKENLYTKDIQLKERLQHIKLDRAIMQCQRRQIELHKNEAVQEIQEEQNIDNQLRKEEIFHHLEHRLARADCIREQYLNAYKRRLKHDNYMEEILHEENFKEAEKFENFKKEQLKQKINRKSCRTRQFVEQKQKNYDHLVERAKLSASLRDLVRRSVSPDGMQFYSAGRCVGSGGSRQHLLFYDRPLSNLSYQYQSCVKFE